MSRRTHIINTRIYIYNVKIPKRKNGPLRLWQKWRRLACDLTALNFLTNENPSFTNNRGSILHTKQENLFLCEWVRFTTCTIYIYIYSACVIFHLLYKFPLFQNLWPFIVLLLSFMLLRSYVRKLVPFLYYFIGPSFLVYRLVTVLLLWRVSVLCVSLHNLGICTFHVRVT